MHQIYEDKGSFNFIYNLPQIALSALISGIIGAIIQYLALTSSILTELKEKGKKENIDNLSKDAMTNIKIKSIFFFFFCLILLIFFWFYLGCFCAVYKNTQLHLIKDTLISLGTSMLYPFVVYLLPGCFRLAALNNKKHDKELMYKFSKALQMLWIIFIMK